MDTQRSKKRSNRADRKQNHKHSHIPIKWIAKNPEKFDVSQIENEKITVKGFSASDSWSLRGTIFNGKLGISINNGGESRNSISYDSDKKLMLKDIEWLNLHLYTTDKDGKDTSIYVINIYQ